MKLLLKLLLMISLLNIVACSNSKKSDKSPEGDEVSEVQEDADFIVDEGEDELMAESSSSPEEESINKVEEVKSEAAVTPEIVESSEPSKIQVTSEVSEYTVQSGDTLMLIAFKLYGDYRKWKDIESLNPGVQSESLVSGSTLKYQTPSQKFEWNPEGLPHLIQKEETLGTISNDKYGTENRWKDIYDNNRPMIHDPNLIFAGFTLYYIPDNRDVASE